MTVKGIRVPYVVFENEDDVTTAGGEALGRRLEEALGRLWMLRACLKIPEGGVAQVFARLRAWEITKGATLSLSKGGGRASGKPHPSTGSGCSGDFSDTL